jgi:hypothetical protein
MKSIFALFVLLSLLFGCRSYEISTKSNQINLDTVRVDTGTRNNARQPKGGQPTTIKQNSTFIGATIDSAIVIDSLRYRLRVYLNTAVPESEVSLAEAGQNLELEPGYFVGEQGKIKLDDERNRTLFKLRSAKRGDSFIGSIALEPHSGWVIINVESVMFQPR